MTMTHNQAIKEFKDGNIDIAWEIAIQDEGLLPGVSKADWIKFAKGCVAQEEQLKNVSWYG